MEFIKTLIKNKKLIIQLAKNDFKNKFASTNLGTIWGFVTPFVFVITYVIIFQYILKTNSAGEHPYIVWFLPGISMWMFINDAILSASNSIRNYSYLVKKVFFPIDTIPVITIFSSSIIGIFLIIISIVVCSLFGYLPNILKLVYILVAGYSFIVSLTRLTSAICTIIPDCAHLLSVIMQLCFWFTPIIWNIGMLGEKTVLYEVIKCMPFTYLVNGMRAVFDVDSFITGNQFIPTCIFWVITFSIFILGDMVFNRIKKEFADVL